MSHLISLNLPDPPVSLEEDVRRTPSPDDDFWYMPVNGAFSVDQLIRLAAVGACIRVISETVASLPLHVYERLDNDGRRIAREHPLYGLLHDAPDETRTSFEWLESGIRHILTRGAMLSHVETNARNEVTEISLVDDGFSIYKDEQLGIRVFKYQEDGQQQAIVDSQALFIPGPGCHPYRITSLVEQHAEALGLGSVALQYVRNYFSKGAVGPVFATFPNGMDEKALRNWAEWFSKNFSGADGVRRIPVMAGGGELKSLLIDHRQMQLDEMRARANQDAACVFRVPPHLIQDLSRSTNNNIEHQSIDFAVHCIRPWVSRIEARLNLSLFGPIERSRYYAEFDMDGLLRGDSEAQAKILAAETQNAVRTPNENRKKRNLNPYSHPAADMLWMQGATIPIDYAAEQAQQQPQQGATVTR